MGAAQSTRKITLVNDDKAGVIKLSESLAHRLRGQLEEQQYRQHQRVQEPPAAVAEPDPLPTPILTPPPVDLPPPPPPTLETAKIPSLIPEAPPAEAQTQGESPKDAIVAPVLSKDAHIDNLEPLDLSPEATPEIFPEPSAEPIFETISETSEPFSVESPLSENTETLTFIETRPEPSPPVDNTPIPSEAIVQFLPDEPEVLPSTEEVLPPKSEDVEAVASTIEVAEVETAELSGDIGSGIGEVGSDSTNDAVLMAETVSEVPTVEIPEPETLLAAAFTSSDEPITASAAPDIPSEPDIPTATEPLQVPEPISITPEPVVTPVPPVVQEPVVAAEPIIESEPLVVPEPALVSEPVVPVPEPLVVAEPVVVEPVTVEEPVIIEPVNVVEPVTVAESVITEPVTVAEPVVEVEPVTVAEPVVVEPIILAEPIVVEPVIEAEPVAEAVTEPSPVVAGEPEPTLVAAFPETLAVTPGASPKLDVAAVAADIAAAAVTSPAPAVTSTTTEIAETVPEAAPVEAESLPPPPAAAVAVPDVGFAVQAGAGPTLAAPGGTIPPWSIYAEEAHLMVMRLKAEKDQEIKKLSDDWRAKLDQREEEFVKTSALTEENFSASLKEVEAMFVKATCDPVCQNQQEGVMKCYQDHPHQSLRCAREVSQFAQCVDLSRLQSVMKQN